MMSTEILAGTDWVWADEASAEDNARPYEFSLIRAEDNVRVALLMLLMVAVLAAPELMTHKLLLYMGLIVGAFLSMWARFEADWLRLRRSGALGNGAVVIVLGDLLWLSLVVAGSGGINGPFIALLVVPILFSVALFSRLRLGVMLVTAMVSVVYIGFALHAGSEPWRLTGLLLAVMSLAWVAHVVCQVLERERRANELIIRNMSDAVLLLDPDGRIVVANRQLERLTGIEPRAAVGGRARDIVRACPEEPLALLLADVARPPRSQVISVREITLTGPETLDISVSTTRCMASTGECIGHVVVAHDITPVKSAMRARQSGARAIVGRAASPLTTLRVAAAMLEALSERIDERNLARFAEVLDAETQRLVLTAGELLNVSALEEPDLGLVKTPSDIGALVRKVWRVAGLRADSGQIKMEGEITGDLSAVPVDAERLESALHRLCENAIQYTDPGGSVVVRASRADETVSISVSDTGVGIPTDQHQRIFEKFATAEGAEGRGGAGLGLYVVKRIAELHGGRVLVESQPGAGSTFTIELPVGEAAVHSGPEDQSRAA